MLRSHVILSDLRVSIPHYSFLTMLIVRRGRKIRDTTGSSVFSSVLFGVDAVHKIDAPCRAPATRLVRAEA